MSEKDPLNILHINASARGASSMSRQLVGDLIAALQERHNDVHVTRRNVATGLPFVDEEWVAANNTPEEERDNEQRDKLALSDQLVAELAAADVLVIGTPIYNFSIPASLKAWVDMIARARLTFRYTKDGVEGLLADRKTYVVVPSGGVPVGSPVDFATPYLRHVLGFVGITDIEFIGARGADRGNHEALDAARARIAELVHLGPRAA
ncbi:MAG: NAD(P)H-dependent oxidoreductase [Gammaproteobacteria bacterium]|nr:NAD(P)H-dependent oxidoreductase [Gammaproteobacteria bacterium]NNF50628.1 FMN-dependent NADH-azoreductase [Woeseiaceae bacterium]